MGTRNTLVDLNNHLFEQLERVNDDELVGDKLQEELSRTKAMADLSKQIIDNAKLALEAEKFKDDRWDADSKLPRMLESKKDE